jgi:hypothetical protein
LFLIGLVTATGAPVGCHKSKKSAPGGEAVKQSLDRLKSQLAELKTRFMDLRTRVEEVPPNLPGFGEARARFYAAEEARGITDGKAAWLSGRLDAAIASGNGEELQQISTEIASSNQDIHKIEELHVKLLHEIMSFQRMARDQEQAEKEAAAAPSPKPEPAKTKRSKAKANAN